MRSRAALIGLPLGAALLLSACGGGPTAEPEGGEDNHRLYVETVRINGDDITCVVYDDSKYSQGGVSCDWIEPEEN